MPPVPADPTVLHPMPEHPRVVLLKPLLKSPLIEVGDYSYYDDPDDPTAFETRNVLYHYGPERLVISKYCALGTGTRFIMNGANHRGPHCPTRQAQLRPEDRPQPVSINASQGAKDL